MKQFNNFRRVLGAAAILAAAVAMTLAGCTKVDDTLGSNLVPDNQQMRAGFTSLAAQTLTGELNPKRYIETRLFQTDSIVASNLSYGYMGSMLNDTFGLRSAGFLTQYLNYYKVDSGYFGYKPIFDSAQLLLSIESYGSDTTTVQKFAVYEVLSNDYLTEKPVAPGKTERDTVFYLNFNPEKEGLYDKTHPLFTFTLGGDKGPSTLAVTLEPTTYGREFIDRLMLQEGKYKGDYSIYSVDSLEQWVEEFKGLYIVSAEDQTTPGKGNIYGTSLEASGLSVYARNRVKDDPTLIKDTIGMVYYFYESSSEYGNVSVNTIRHDYTKATSAQKFEIADAVETNEDRPLSSQVYVAGMGGVVTEFTFTKEFFDALEAEIVAGNDYVDPDDIKDEVFTTLAVSQAKMSIYFDGSNYDWQNLNNIPHLIGQMDASQTRLGLYTDFKRLSGIADYAYAYEQSYNTTLSYGGYINRSRGCYEMDITAFVQGLWNNYLKAKREAGGEGAQWDDFKDNIKNRTIYLGPEAYSLYTQAYSVMRGMTPIDGSLTREMVPIKIDLAYNLIK